jgi:hypothetical protein
LIAPLTLFLFDESFTQVKGIPAKLRINFYGFLKTGDHFFQPALLLKFSTLFNIIDVHNF